jgi:hypothetical protein
VDDGHDCVICLEPVVGATTLLTLPCGHAFHRVCVFAVLTAPVLGACSMFRCPMCRASVDRHDLGALGVDVSPHRLCLAQQRCDSLRRLVAGVQTPHHQQLPVMHAVATLVRRCTATEAVDGFLYNVAVLAIERTLFHRINLIRSLETQLRAPRNRRFDPVEFIRTSLACHVEHLIRTATMNVPS